MNTVEVKGVVFSGEATGSQFIGISWAKRQIKEKLGFDTYIGTLNIRLSEKYVKLLERILKDFKGIKIVPAKGFFQAKCFRVLVMNKIRGAIVLPEKPDYPSNVLEIIAPVCLRKELSLDDGDEIKIAIRLNTNVKT